jgi:hypothetical protein
VDAWLLAALINQNPESVTVEIQAALRHKILVNGREMPKTVETNPPLPRRPGRPRKMEAGRI